MSNAVNDNATQSAPGFRIMVKNGEATIPRTRFTISVDGVRVLCLWSKNIATAATLAAKLLGVPQASITVRRIQWSL